MTSRCNVSQYETIKVSEMDIDTELTELFYKQCPSAKESEDIVKELIQTVGAHTLTVCLTALSLTASGMEPEELLTELKSCGLNFSSSENVELYKDNDFADGLMIEHLRKLLQLGRLSDEQINILRNLCLLPTSGILKARFKNWLQLDMLTDVNHLIKYGFITEDTDNKKISLHPLLQEVLAIESMPTVSSCRTMLDSLHVICLAHGVELRRPEIIISSLISITERILIDDGEYFLLFLQDMFPYLDKYYVVDYLPKLIARMDYLMTEHGISSPCDKALLSNLYNNLSNTYLLMKQGNNATKALRTAFDIRMEYAHLGLAESHDMLQQMMNLINMLLLAKDVDDAKIVLQQYEKMSIAAPVLAQGDIMRKIHGGDSRHESLVLEHLSDTSLDYGICKLNHGIIDLMEGKPELAEENLLEAERLIENAIGTENDYAKTTYRYLNNLYAKWNKKEKAVEYRDKYLNINRIITNRNA